MKIFDNPKKSIWLELVKRPAYSYKSLDNIVKEVFLEVEKNGDRALKNYTLKFETFDSKTIVSSTIEKTLPD